MGLKMPSINTDSLKKGVWGNTWRNWGYIVLAFTLLYLFEAGILTGLLFAAKEIRGYDYRTLPNEYMGRFDRPNLPAYFPLSAEDPLTEPFNRPQDCEEILEQVTLTSIGETLTRPSGIQKCTVTNKNPAWSIFPWVADLSATIQGGYPGCAQAAENGYATVIDSSSPAYNGDGVAKPEKALATVCQNFMPVSIPQDISDAIAVELGTLASAPAP